MSFIALTVMIINQFLGADAGAVIGSSVAGFDDGTAVMTASSVRNNRS